MATATANPWDQDEIVTPAAGNPWDADPVAESNPWDADPLAEDVQNPLVTTGAALVKGLADVGPAIIGGGAKLMDAGADVVAKWTGEEKGGLFGNVAQFMDDIGEESARLYPVDSNNPIAATIGGGAAQGLGLLAGGAVGKGLGLANAATVPLAAGFAMGAGSGIDKAKEIGVESPEGQMAMGLLYGGTELATERLMGIGNKQATEALLNAGKKSAEELLKRAAKTVTGEGGEEILAGTAQDLIARAFAAEDPANPGFTKTGVKLPAMDKQFLKDRGLDFVGGASGGAVFAGADVLMNRGRPEGGPEPMASELNPVEVSPNPFAGPIEAPPQPTEAGGVVPPPPRSPWAPPIDLEGGLSEVVQPDLEADITQGLPQAMQPSVEVPFEEAPAGLDGVPFEEAPAGLQPWDNDPIVEDVTPTADVETVRDAGPAADAAGAGGEVDLFGNPIVEEAVAPSALESLATVEVPLANLTLSQDVPQFKSDADERTGVVEPLAGSYQRLGTGPILVWERTDGRREVISGRHRFDLARRTGETIIPAQVVREADGFTREMAVMADAELNIRDGQGKVKDYANYFRNAGIDETEAEARGLRARAAGRAGWAIGTQGSPAVFELHANGRLSDAAAEALARTAPGNEALQRVGAQSILDGQPIDVSVNLMRVMQSEFGGAGTAEQMDLFGADDSAMQAMREQAKRAALIQRNLREQVAAVQGAAKRPEKAREMGVNVQDPEAVRQRVQELKQELERWESWPLHEDLRAQVRGQLAPGQAFVQAEPDGVLEVTVPTVDDFQLQPATAEELEAEARKQAQAKAIDDRRARPLQGNAGEFGTPDMLDTTAGPMALFGQPLSLGQPSPVRPEQMSPDEWADANLTPALAAMAKAGTQVNREALLSAHKEQLVQAIAEGKPINEQAFKYHTRTGWPSTIEAKAARYVITQDGSGLMQSPVVSKPVARRKQTAKVEQVEALSPKYAMPFAKGPLTTMHYAQLPPTATGQVWSGKIRTLHGIRQKLLGAAGLSQVGVGRFARALGIYKVKPETIRLQAINDIPVLAHELGHAIHYRELSADRTKADSWGGRYDVELMALGQATSTPTYTPDQVRKEGVAEFTRLWLTDTAKARAEAPTFSAFWEAELERKNPKLARGLREAREEIADYIAMPAFQKAKAQIAFDPTAEKVPKTLGARLRDTYAKWVNTLQPALDVVRQAAVVDPNQAVRAKEVEAWMENHRGGWASKAHADIFGNQTTLDGRRLGPGMAQILKEIGPNQAESFSTYLALKRAAEIERQGKRSGFENAKLPPAEMKRLEARFEATRQKLLKWSNNELQLLVDSGLLDGQSVAKMRQLNQDYVPFYRIYEKLNGVSFGPEGGKNSGGYVDLNSGIRRLKGSDRAIVDPLQSLMKNAFMFRKIAEQNHIGVQFFDLLSDVQGHGKWTEQVRPKQKQTVIKHEQMVQKLIDEGVIQSEADLPQDADLTLRLFEAIQRPDTAKGEVIVFKDGQRQHWEVKDPVLMEALKNSDGDSIKLWKFLGGTLGKAVTLPTRVVRFGATGGPWFALPNFLRDQVIAGVQSRTGFIPFVDGVRGAFEVMRKGDMYQRWIEAGGKYHGLTTGTQAFTDLLEDALPKEPGARRAMETLANPRNWKKALSYAGEVLEEATRVQEYARGVRQGLPEMQAANLSKTVSLNFARAGERGRALNQIIAFTNAKIQDLDLIVRSHLDPARRGQVMAKGFLYITVPSILTWWLGKDDEEIQNLPEWRKNMFWNINMGPVARALGRESFVLSIPKPFLMGAIYGTSVERALDYATDRDPNGMRKAMKNLMANGPDGLNPVEMAMSVAGLKPLIEATTNYNLFQKREVVPERMKFLPKEQQYDIHTSEVAKMVGKFTGQSPMVVDHLLRGYFATAGKFGTDAVDYGMAKLGAADVPPAPAKDLMEAPILNRFSGSPYAANAFVDRFYKATQEMEGKLAVWNKQAEQMTEPAQKAWWEKNGAELQHFLRTVNYDTGLTGAGQVRKAMEAMSDMNKAMKEVQASRVMSPEEKRQRMMRLSLMRNEVAENAFKQLFPEPVRKRHY